MLKASVIIAFVNDLPSLIECLTALGQQECDFDFEIIVIDRTLNESEQYLKENFPRVNLIKRSAPCGIPEMRAIGIENAGGEYLVITEDHCIVPPNWLAKIIEAHKTGYKVVGGAVENASSERLIDWAVFLCEYSNFMPPIIEGETQFLTGNNTSYKRSVIDQLDDSLKRNYWEYFLQAELKRRNITFYSVSTLIINHKKEFGFFYFLSQRFHYSRSFAAMRKNQSSTLKQIIYILYTPILPFHLIWRIAQNVHQKRRNYKEFFLSLPLLVIFMMSYAVGELTGLIFGSGNSLLKVE